MSGLLRLFLSFAKISLVGFGGGYGIMSIMFSEVEKYSITAKQFADLVAIELVVPGPIAINAATYTGYLFRGLAGAVVATVALSLPCAILSLVTLKFIEKFRENAVLQSFLKGIKPAAIGLIASAGITIGMDALFASDASGFSLVAALLFAIVFVILVKFKKVSPILLTVCAGIVGALFIR